MRWLWLWSLVTLGGFACDDGEGTCTEACECPGGELMAKLCTAERCPCEVTPPRGDAHVGELGDAGRLDDASVTPDMAEDPMREDARVEPEPTDASVNVDEPDVADPLESDAAEPDAAEPDAAEPDAAEPDAAPPAPPALQCPVGPPEFADRVRVNRTIVLDEPGVYDYENVLHEWSGSGRCTQQENQPYILRIAASNVTLRNFAYRGAPDGIHIGTSSNGQGHSDGRAIRNIRLENVTGWACEDALTTQFGVEDVTIEDSRFFPNPDSDERDKLLQLNFGDVTIRNSAFDGGDAGVCVMFKGGQQIRIENSCFSDCDRAVNGSTQNGIVGRVSTDPSEVHAIGNVGRFPDRALIFWDPWRFLTADGEVHCIGENNTLHDGGINDMREGATIEYR